MNPNILNQNPLMFFDRAVNAQRSQLLTVMADAVSECRTAADQAAELNETGQVGLLRLAEIWSAIRAKEGMGGLVLEGTEAKILSDASVPSRIRPPIPSLARMALQTSARRRSPT